jgi:hypothetical protein
LVKVTIRLSHQNCICKDVKSQMALPTFFMHGGPKMMSMLLPMGRRKASILNVPPSMRSGTMKQAPCQESSMPLPMSTVVLMRRSMRPMMGRC